MIKETITMEGYKFFDENGTFVIQDPDLYSYLYFPVGAASGMMGCVTPELGGDLKTSQNTFILEPVSSDNLHRVRLQGGCPRRRTSFRDTWRLPEWRDGLQSGT